MAKTKIKKVDAVDLKAVIQAAIYASIEKNEKRIQKKEQTKKVKAELVKAMAKKYKK